MVNGILVCLFVRPKLIIEVLRGLQKTNLAAIFHGGRIGGAVASVVTVLVLVWSWNITRHLQLSTAISYLVIGALVSFLLAGLILRNQIVNNL